jgi:hypothetical protein
MGSTLDWTVRQLNIQPYQHLLEVGYGSGLLLAEVARALRIGYLAGIESSIPHYQKAYRRNRPFIRQQLMQLHLGELYELSYPTQYFHTIYGSDSHCAWKDTGTECLRLSALLKTDGQLVLVSKRRKDQDVRTLASHLQESYLEAGFIDIFTEYRDLPSGTCVAVKGLKGDPLPYR